MQCKVSTTDMGCCRALAVCVLQGCKLVGDAAGGYLLNFQGLLGVQLMFQQPAAAEAGSATQVSGRLVLLPARPAAATAAGAPAEGALKLQLLQDTGECCGRSYHMRASRRFSPGSGRTSCAPGMVCHIAPTSLLPCCAGLSACSCRAAEPLQIPVPPGLFHKSRLTCPLLAVLVCAYAVVALQSRCSFLCVPGLVRESLTEAEAVASRALELADACQEVYLSQPLLTGVSIRQGPLNTQQDDIQAQGGDQMQVDGQAQNGSDGGEGGGELVLTVVEPDAKVKVEVALRLRDLLGHAHPGTHNKLSIGRSKTTHNKQSLGAPGGVWGGVHLAGGGLFAIGSLGSDSDVCDMWVALLLC